MAFSVGTIEGSLTLNMSRFSQALNRAFREGSQFSRQMQAQFRQIGASAFRLGTQLTAGLTVPLLGAGTLAVKTAADYEQLQIQLNTLAGSAEEGARSFERLQDFSAGTPFQLDDLVRANNVITTMAGSTDEAFRHLQTLGDVASGTGANINELATTFSQAASEGVLMTRDIREFTNRGVPLTRLLADSMGVATNEVFDLASQSKVTFDVLVDALEDATTGTGLYAGATERAADSISGVFSTLRDNVNRALSEIGNTIIDIFDIKELIRGLTTNIQQGITWFNSLSQETRKVALTIVGLLGAAGPVIAALGALSFAIGAISAPVAGVVTAIVGATAAIISNWSDVERYFTTGGGARVFDNLRVIVQDVVSIVSSLWGFLGDDLIETTTIAWRAISETIGFFLNNARTVTSVFANAMRGEWRQLWEDLRVDTENINNQIVGVVSDVWSTLLTQLRQDVIRTFEVIFRVMSLTPIESVRVAGEMGEAWISALTEMENAAWDAGVTIRENIETNATAAVESVMSAVSNIPDATAIVRPSVNLSEPIPEIIDVDEIISGFEQISGFLDGKLKSDGTVFDIDIEKYKMAVSSFQEINDIVGEMASEGDFSHRFFPPGSIADINAQMQVLREQMQLVSNPEQFSELNAQIGVMQERLAEIRGSAEENTNEFSRFGAMVAQVFDRAIFQGQRLHSILSSLLRQLASQAFVALLTGGTGGVGGILGGLFGGSFHAGGIVPGSGEQLALVEGGEGIFTRQQMRALGGRQGGGEVNLNIKLSGQFEQRGDTLEAIVREEVRRQVRLQ